MSEYEPLDQEQALREYISMLRERWERDRRELNALEKEIRQREGEFIAIRAGRWVDDGE
jgi:hypothetical protein